MNKDKELQEMIDGVMEIANIQRKKSAEQIGKESQEAYLKQKDKRITNKQSFTTKEDSI
jgi:hypothetical protein